MATNRTTVFFFSCDFPLHGSPFVVSYLNVSDCFVHQASGIVLIRWFPDKSRARRGRFTKESGTDPFKSLYDKFKYCSDFSKENLSDIAPFKSLLDKSRDVTPEVTPSL